MPKRRTWKSERTDHRAERRASREMLDQIDPWDPDPEEEEEIVVTAPHVRQSDAELRGCDFLTDEAKKEQVKAEHQRASAEA